MPVATRPIKSSKSLIDINPWAVRRGLAQDTSRSSQSPSLDAFPPHAIHRWSPLALEFNISAWPTHGIRDILGACRPLKATIDPFRLGTKVRRLEAHLFRKKPPFKPSPSFSCSLDLTSITIAINPIQLKPYQVYLSPMEPPNSLLLLGVRSPRFS